MNALSAWLEAELHQDGLVVRQRFERGQAVAPPAAVGPTDRAGLTVSFLPDPTVFQAGAAVGADWLARRLRELSYLHPGLQATLEVNGHAPSAETFCAERGVEDGLAALVGDARTLLSAPLVASGREQVTPGALPVVVDVALTWTRQEGEQVVDYANGVLLRDGGTHRAALRAAVTRALSPLGDGTRGVDWCQGLAAFVSLKVPEPLYQGCTRSRLANPEVAPLLRRLVGRALTDLVAARPAEAQRVVKQALARSRRKKLPRARAQGPLP